MIKIAVDAMGGDNAPVCNVQGAVEAINESDEIEVILVGQEDIIRRELSSLKYDTARLSIVNASEIIETGEPPVSAIQKKKDSSLVVGMRMLRNKDVDAFVSCGSTGAILVGGQVIAGRLKGVSRAALALVFPTLKGYSILIDCGANVDAKKENLVQFACMGSMYLKHVLHYENPTVGLINIGVEEEKGNALTKETYPLLKECKAINFIGNVEAREIPYGAADVYVCEAFTGNVILKLYEGTGKALMKEMKDAMMSSFTGKLGGLLAKKSLKGLKERFDTSKHGGAPLLGLNGLVVKAHGNSTSVQMKNAILQCIDFKKYDMNAKLEEAIGEL